MILKIILLLATVFAFYLTIRIKKTFPAIVTIGMILGVLLSLFLPGANLSPGIYVYMGFVALAFIYGLTAREKEPGTRIVVCLMAASIFVYWLWIMNHWHGNERLAPVLAILAGLAGIIGKVKLKEEASFLIILVADAIAILIEIWLKTG